MSAVPHRARRLGGTGRRRVRIVVLGGAGIIGRAIARDLADDREVEEIVLADLDVDGARKVAVGLGRPGVVAVKADVTDHGALVNLVKGAGAVINSVQYYFNLRSEEHTSESSH